MDGSWRKQMTDEKKCPNCGEPLDSHGLGDMAVCLEELAE